MADLTQLRELVGYPREALAVETKAWVDPATPHGTAKLVAALFALRNQGGGFLILGFDNKTLQPTDVGRPADVRLTFHADIVQRLIGRYASEPFEAVVHFVDREGQDFPVIEVPAGVVTPLATKASLVDSDGKEVIRPDVVWVRTLNANHTPSSAKASWKDWPALVETCFDNREADIGRFLRRHLTDANLDALRQLLDAPRPAASGSEEALARLQTILKAGGERLQQVAQERRGGLPKLGGWEFAAIVRGAPPSKGANLDLLNGLLSSNPNLTGWPIFVDSRRFGNESGRPYHTADEAWEAFIDTTDSDFGAGIDFWRLTSRAEYYHYRTYQDDSRAPHKGAEFDFGLPVMRVAEALLVGQAFARALGVDEDASSVLFLFRWRQLRDRVLSSWAQPNRLLSPGRRAYKDTAESLVEVPVAMPATAIAATVQAATAPLFEAFDEFALAPTVIESIVRELLARRR
jgi:hypothetical protein